MAPCGTDSEPTKPSADPRVVADLADVRNTDVVGDEADGPLRRCIVTRAVKPKADLIRFVLDPQGAVVADLAERLPGRGFWVSADRAVLDRAAARGGFAKAARRPVTIAPDLADALIHLLTARCGDAMALARRAGQAVTGFEKVRAWSRTGQTRVYVLAQEATANARAKALAVMGTAALVDCLPSPVIGGAFGRDGAVHAALAEGGLARRLLVDASKLRGLLGLSTAPDRTTIGPKQGKGRHLGADPMRIG